MFLLQSFIRMHIEEINVTAELVKRERFITKNEVFINHLQTEYATLEKCFFLTVQECKMTGIFMGFR